MNFLFRLVSVVKSAKTFQEGFKKANGGSRSRSRWRHAGPFQRTRKAGTGARRQYDTRRTFGARVRLSKPRNGFAGRRNKDIFAQVTECFRPRRGVETTWKPFNGSACAARGSQKAAKMQRTLLERMTPEQQTEARQQAAAFVAARARKSGT